MNYRCRRLASHWAEVGRPDKAVEAYNKSAATLESRVLVSARRLRDLTAAPVCGPLLVGAGRFHGDGFCRPLNGGDGAQ